RSFTTAPCDVNPSTTAQCDANPSTTAPCDANPSTTTPCDANPSTSSHSDPRPLPSPIFSLNHTSQIFSSLHTHAHLPTPAGVDYGLAVQIE
ncbi:hypothetical protein AVEN_275458-1, partial [Araneus ventricosus]